MEGDDYVGHCVNVASRLCDLAGAGEALVAPSVMGDLPSWGVALQETQVTLRGVEKPVPVTSISMAARRGGHAARPHLRAPPHARHGGGDRPRRARLGGALLLAGVRGHLAPAAGPHRRLNEPGRASARSGRAQLDLFSLNRTAHLIAGFGPADITFATTGGDTSGGDSG